MVHKLTGVAKASVLFLTGEASVHAVYDHCLLDYLCQAGVYDKWTNLADVNIKSNEHFMILEKNSDAIADFMSKWIEKL